MILPCVDGSPGDGSLAGGVVGMGGVLSLGGGTRGLLLVGATDCSAAIHRLKHKEL